MSATDGLNLNAMGLGDMIHHASESDVLHWQRHCPHDLRVSYNPGTVRT